MSNSLLLVTVDSREPKWAQSIDFAPATSSVDALDAGDYKLICSDGAIVLVERKEPGDLLNTIREGRLFDQCARLQDQSQWPYLLITGELRSNKDEKVILNGRGVTGWNINAVWGVLADVQEMGVTVIFCQSDGNLKEALLRIAARDRSKKRIAPKREHEELLDYQKVLLSFPGVGPKALEKLETAFPESPITMLMAMLAPEGNDVIGEYLVGRNRYTMMMWADTKLGLTKYDTPVIIEKGAKPYD